MEFTLGELFSGPGGLARGAMNINFTHEGEPYGIKHGWANDIDFDSCETYIRNILNANKENVICEDIKNLDITKLIDIDAFAYGYAQWQ
jgi:DNA (cytosine-5)-methyltransferase 1